MPLELFFDLVFVLALTQCTALMAVNATWEGIAQAMVVLALLWWSWGERVAPSQERRDGRDPSSISEVAQTLGFEALTVRSLDLCGSAVEASTAASDRQTPLDQPEEMSHLQH